MTRTARALRSIIGRSAWATCAALVVRNFQDARRFRRGSIETRSGTLHARLNVAESLRYIREVFDDYRRYSGVPRFQGRVAEVGPGDSCGVGLLFLADGCDAVDLVDRFHSQRDPARLADVYRALLAEHAALRTRFGHLPAEEASYEGVRRYYGAEAAGETFFADHGEYDFIVSRAVCEHLYDPLLAMRRMAEALRPGGMLLHKIDLRDHGLFSRRFHELRFLEVPDWLYPRMVRDSGRPNRVLVHRYRAVSKEAGLSARFLVTRLAGEGDVTPHRPWDEIPADRRERALDYVRSVRRRFAPSLREVADEDLAVSGVFVVARRPAESENAPRG